MKTVKNAQGRKRKDLVTERTSATNPKPKVYDIIGKRLRGYFDDVASQPVPDRFVELLNELAAKTPGKKRQ